MGSAAMDGKINYRTIGAMTIIWLLLLAYLVWLPELNERSGLDGAFITEENAVEHIVQITIKMQDGRSIQYVRMSDQWQIEKPYRAVANEPMIKELLEAVEKTRIMDIVEKQPEALSQYGLEENQRMEVALAFEDGTERTYFIGARLPLNQIYVYFQKEEDPSVFRAWEGIRSVLEKYAAVLDQGHPVLFSPSTIVSLELLDEEHSLHMEKRGENWFTTRPVRRAADNAAVHAYLESIQTLKSSGAYPSGAISQEKFRGTGYLKLILTRGMGKGPITLRLAPEDASGPPLLSIEQDGHSAVYLTDPPAIDKLSINPNDFFLPYALLLNNETVTHIEISHPNYSLELDRDSAGSWRFQYPHLGQRADADMVGQLLHLLGNLPVEQYLEEEKGEIGISDSDILIKLTAKTVTTSLRMSKSPEGYYRGTSALHPNWFRLNSDGVTQLGKFGPEALVDRYLLVFDPRSVEKIVVNQGEKNYILTRKGSGWDWEKPKKRKARNAVAWKLVFGIRDFQYQKQVGENKIALTDGDSCVIQDPDIVIQVVQAGAGGDSQMRMKASKAGKELIVSTSRFPGCYQLEGDAVDQLLPGPAAFTDAR